MVAKHGYQLGPCKMGTASGFEKDPAGSSSTAYGASRVARAIGENAKSPATPGAGVFKILGYAAEGFGAIRSEYCAKPAREQALMRLRTSPPP